MFGMSCRNQHHSHRQLSVVLSLFLFLAAPRLGLMAVPAAQAGAGYLLENQLSTPLLVAGEAARNTVLSSATALGDSVAYSVAPASPYFGIVTIGDSRNLGIVVTNQGTSPLALEPSIVGPYTGFSLLEGQGPQSVAPGEFLLIVVRFAPEAEGLLAADLDLGPGLNPVLMSGEGLLETADCVIDPPRVVFGPVILGETATKEAVVTNMGDTAILLDPVADNPAITVVAAEAVVQPGASVTLTVTFVQTETTITNATVDLGDSVCDVLRVVASPALDIEPDVDLLGLFWDDAHVQNNITVSEAGTVVMAYLVLANPIMAGGVAGWECRVEQIGSAVDLGWTLSGPNVNVGTYPDFIVGLGVPLPYETEVVLASVQYLVIDPFDVTLLSLVPTSIQSVPDRMSWVSGDNFDLLLGMQPATGEPLVATINGDAPVAVQLPSPSLRAQGGRVELSWPIVGVDWDAYYVYRRVDDQQPERLTGQPQSAQGGTLVFTDEIGSLAGGTRLFYSYATLRDGQEVGRSTEVEFVVPGVRAVTGRLQPNVPNPFNPATQLRFELGVEGDVELTIFDTRGRRVRSFAVGPQSAGAHSVLWDGTDQSGRPMASGVYHVQLVMRSGGAVVRDVRSVVLVE